MLQMQFVLIPYSSVCAGSDSVLSLFVKQQVKPILSSNFGHGDQRRLM
jgi:hypothetical protein